MEVKIYVCKGWKSKCIWILAQVLPLDYQHTSNSAPIVIRKMEKFLPTQNQTENIVDYHATGEQLTNQNDWIGENHRQMNERTREQSRNKVNI